MMDNSFSCDECGKLYSNCGSLRKHVKLKHPDLVGVIAPCLPRKATQSFECNVCQKKFSKKCHVVRHKETIHNIVRNYSVKYQCVLCRNETHSQTALYEHYGNSHDVNIETEDIEFDTFDMFIAWKCDMEKKTKSKFIKTTGDKRKNSYYTCHRSGNYVPRGNGERCLKIQGTCKIGSVCPASMKVKKVAGEKVRVCFTKTHVGHTAELKHLWLDSNDRNWLATKIAEKVPLKDILHQVRDSISDTNLERLHLLTRWDLQNILRSYKLNRFVLGDQNVSVRESSVIEKMEKSDNESALSDCKIHVKKLSTLHHSSLEETKVLLKQEVTKVLTIIDNCKTLDELQTIQRSIASINPNLLRCTRI